jgi:hypothetical protein
VRGGVGIHGEPWQHSGFLFDGMGLFLNYIAHEFIYFPFRVDAI